MGTCLSCCRQAASPGTTARHSTSAGQDSKHSTTPISLNSHRPQTRLNAHISRHKPIHLATDNQSQIISGQTPVAATTDKKMFTPYMKLPPIKKQGSTDGKRLSLISRDYSESKIQALYDHYKDTTEDAILADGIERFCEDLDVKPDEFTVLVLAWKFEAETMCRFTHEEFLSGCRSLKVDSIKAIQSKFPDLLSEVQNKQSFKDMYRWAYKFGLDADTGQRTLPIEMAMSLWKLVFSQQEPAILERWLSFLEKHPLIRGIPRDTWDMFLNFTELVGDDLSSYDDTEAWPSLLDDFVEYENDCQNQNVKTD